MRASLLLGAAVVVIIVGALAFFALRSNQIERSESVNEEEAAELDTGNGQFFQEIPGGALNITTSPSGTSAPVPAAGVTGTEAVTITMSESGFSPSTVTIAAGTTVTFINNGQAAHWPASDVHPTHNILPSFDSKRGLATGDSYSYTFDEVGTWRCHDHLLPQFTCTIVVK